MAVVILWYIAQSDFREESYRLQGNFMVVSEINPLIFI